ncbi:MAG: Asp-tRNA(Asn)/Glu-tRNA(Gln) amidotransferase subunit GatA, partial [Acidisphaera sp.]|nr:Asp-tRNA(Asn)/Glu-tRNA(Gln) amidotransferase subunit GatA [Acidisphaera sp.]
MSLGDLTLIAARDGLRARRFSSRELTEHFLSAIEALNPRLNAFVTVTAEGARAQADAADAALARGETRPLLGLPLGIKDLFCTRGVRTTAGSTILGPFVPPYESTVTANLLRDGAVFLGKTNMDEFAMGSSNMTSAYGPVENPWKRRQDDPDDPRGAVLVPGGSSGGSAAAVAARLALGATATDTGGSIRQPASFCGIAGIKPTYGRCSRWGIVAFASSLDQAGPVARTVADCAALLGSMAGHDPKDSTSVDRPVPDYEAACRRSIAGLRIGVPREYRADGMSGEIEALWQQGLGWLRDAGADIRDVSLPHT